MPRGRPKKNVEPVEVGSPDANMGLFVTMQKDGNLYRAELWRQDAHGMTLEKESEWDRLDGAFTKGAIWLKQIGRGEIV